MATDRLSKKTVEAQIFALDNDLDAASATASAASAAAAAAQTRADGAQETANNAMTRADSAQETANNAMTRADSAQADANTALASVSEIAPLDSTPAEGSTKGVTSGGVYDAIAAAGGLTLEDITDQCIFESTVETHTGGIFRLGRLLIFSMTLWGSLAANALLLTLPSDIAITYNGETLGVVNTSYSYMSYANVVKSNRTVRNGPIQASNGVKLIGSVMIDA